MWGDLIARTLAAGGVKPGDLLQNAYGYGLFTGGLGLHFGAEHLGCTVVPISGGNTERQLKIMRDFGATALSCTPSYAMYLGDAARDRGLRPEDLPIRVGFHGAEPWTNELRLQIEAALGIDALDIYGLSEMGGPGVAFECLCKAGMHVNEDHYLAEIVDPETLRPLPEGEVGELVFTTLSRQAQPLIRYRTRDLCSLIYEPCACGRTSARMTKPVGRSDDMLIIRGVNVFPSQIEEVLMSIPEIEPHYQIVVDRKGYLDMHRGVGRGGRGHLRRDDGRPGALPAQGPGPDLQRAQHPGRGQAQGAARHPALGGQGRARGGPSSALTKA